MHVRPDKLTRFFCELSINTKTIFALSFVLLFSQAAAATTWFQSKKDDPISKGDKCDVSEPGSWGGYIYQWPSKYDQVFWPLIDTDGIWFCRKSGFTAFIGDFDGMTPDEVKVVSEYLAANYSPGKSMPALPELLKLLEGCYSSRKYNPAFQIKLLRVLAYYHEDALHDPAAAKNYREKALVEIKKSLNTETAGENRLEYLFVAAAYEREYGSSVASDGYLKLLTDALSANTDDKKKDYVEYLTELSKDIPRIKPGGVLAPEPEAKAETETETLKK